MIRKYYRLIYHITWWIKILKDILRPLIHIKFGYDLDDRNPLKKNVFEIIIHFTQKKKRVVIIYSLISSTIINSILIYDLSSLMQFNYNLILSRWSLSFLHITQILFWEIYLFPSYSLIILLFFHFRQGPLFLSKLKSIKLLVYTFINLIQF